MHADNSSPETASLNKNRGKTQILETCRHTFTLSLAYLALAATNRGVQAWDYPPSVWDTAPVQALDTLGQGRRADSGFPRQNLQRGSLHKGGNPGSHANMKRSTLRLQHIHDTQKYCSPSTTWPSPSQYIIRGATRSQTGGGVVPVATEPSCRHWCDALQSGDAFPLPPPRPAPPQAQPLAQAWRKARVEGAHNG